MNEHRDPDTFIVGAGLAGLVAAIDLAQRGQRVVVLERSSVVGGRARSTSAKGHVFNLGPHAVYCGAALDRTLKEFDVRIGAHRVAPTGFFLDSGRRDVAITGLVSLLSTSALDLGGKFEMARFLARLERIDAPSLARTTTRAFIQDTFANPRARRIAFALARLSTYCDDPDHLSAEVFVHQLRAATFKGVQYVDGGWQTIVDGLVAHAESVGVRFETKRRVHRIVPAARGVALELDGATRRANAVIIAGSADVAAELTEAVVLKRIAKAARPVRAAALDVAVTSLPDPRAQFGLGIDEPTYFSVHSAFADLGPRGTATIHAAVYGPSAGDEERMDRAIDQMQPGWRERLVHRRFVPSLVVATDTVCAKGGGFAGRPDVDVAGVPGVFVAGDWVGPEGLLADASAASGRRAAEALLRSADHQHAA